MLFIGGLPPFPSFVFWTDIEAYFDNINHDLLLNKPTWAAPTTQ